MMKAALMYSRWSKSSKDGVNNNNNAWISPNEAANISWSTAPQLQDGWSTEWNNKEFTQTKSHPNGYSVILDKAPAIPNGWGPKGSTQAKSPPKGWVVPKQTPPNKFVGKRLSSQGSPTESSSSCSSSGNWPSAAPNVYKFRGPSPHQNSDSPIGTSTPNTQHDYQKDTVQNGWPDQRLVQNSNTLFSDLDDTDNMLPSFKAIPRESHPTNQKPLKKLVLRKNSSNSYSSQSSVEQAGESPPVRATILKRGSSRTTKTSPIPVVPPKINQVLFPSKRYMVKLPTEIDSIQKWLADLQFMTESECMSVLQGKSLNKDGGEPTVSAAKTIKDRIDAIRNRAHVISAEFAKLFKKIEKERWKYIKSGAMRITSQIRSLLHDVNTGIADMPPYLFEEEAVIMEESAKLAQYIDSLGVINGHKPNTHPLVNILTTLGQSFSAVVDMSLGYLIQTMVQATEEYSNAYTVQSTLTHMISLGLEGEHMCYLIAREGGVRALFDICRQKSLEFAHCQALRAIATVCCVSESIQELEKAGGVECLTDLLCNIDLTEALRSEAAGVIAQITSPCLEHNQHISGFIENMEDLIRSLLYLCVKTNSHEVFLLATAAIANITFMDSMACDFLLQYNAAKVMIEACQLNKAESLFSKDQVATILANMAVLENCSSEITENNGIELLIQFLHEKRSKDSSDAERAACERVHQKAAIALTRLSKDAQSAQIIVELHGVPRLVQLCRNVKERNNSDGVLIACLAALRKISAVCGLKEFTSVDIQQLIKPTLVDSYLICSQLEESFV